MNFFRSKKGILIMLLFVVAAAALIGYCLIGCSKPKEPEGTLVWKEVCLGDKG